MTKPMQERREAAVLPDADGATATGMDGERAELPAGRFGRRRRANVEGGRHPGHKVRVSAAEEARLAVLAEERGVSIPRLLVESTLAPQGGPTVTERRDMAVELFALRRLLAGVANNVNQIARHANAGEELPRNAGAVLAATERVVGRIDRALDGLAG